MVAAHPLLPASRLSEPRSLLSLASSRQPSPFYIQSRHATMNSTNYVAFSFAALFDRLSAARSSAARYYSASRGRE